ncbi:MAG: hypothetical protein CSB34_02260 [Desulfobulbus propionicus]|nr:MAG: hypothetical protein CSB34_02260 [Desulfobulbus propionicus]
MAPVQQLVRYICDQGASQAAWIGVDQLQVDERFALMCKNPECPSYGLSPGCPPHVMSPDAFKKMLKEYQHIVVFRIDMEQHQLHTGHRKGVARLIHHFAALVEQKALEVGYTAALGFGAGSCKELFCEQDASCQVLAGGLCKHPDRARSSVSGVGIDVRALCEVIGWQLSWLEESGGNKPVDMACMMGLTLVG